MEAITLRQVTRDELPIPGADRWYARPGDPALSVMTDFRSRASVTVADHAGIDAALEHMKHTGVRCAFVVDEERRVVVGLITAYDITSEKPMRYAEASNTPRKHVLVRDILQRIAEWRAVTVEDLERATVGDVARIFEDTGLTHIPVMASDAAGAPQLRGLLSASNVRRVLARD